MNLEETAQILGLIASRYPNAKLGEDAALTAQAWQITLADIPLRPHAELALRRWFELKPWAPDASEIRSLALELGGPTPAMVAEAERNRAVDGHWRAMCALKRLGDRERRQWHAAYIAELDSQESDLTTALSGISEAPAQGAADRSFMTPEHERSMA